MQKTTKSGRCQKLFTAQFNMFGSKDLLISIKIRQILLVKTKNAKLEFVMEELFFNQHKT